MEHCDTPLSDAAISEMLHRAGIRPSAHRIAILALMSASRSHPTAEEIHSTLSGKHPRLSKTTVYNTLHIMADAGLLRELGFDSGKQRYDMAPPLRHSHFMCRRCRRIFDLPMPPGLDSHAPGFSVDTIDLCFKGLCPACAESPQ